MQQQKDTGLRRGMVTLRQLQREQADWSVKNFGLHDGWEPLLGVAEEVGELCHAHLKAHQGIRTDENHKMAKVDAVGDILVYLADYCTQEGIDLEQAVSETWRKVQQRDWKRDPVSGE